MCNEKEDYYKKYNKNLLLKDMKQKCKEIHLSKSMLQVLVN